MTVSELVEELKKYPPETLVAKIDTIGGCPLVRPIRKVTFSYNAVPTGIYPPRWASAAVID